MKLKINGKDQVFETPVVTVAELLKMSKVESLDMVSVQLNGKFVGKEKFNSVSLKEGDEIDFLYFMGGGRGNNVPAEGGRDERS